MKLLQKKTDDIENLKIKIHNYDIISFDIFDTLLYRPFLNGDDVLKFLEIKYNVSGWLDARHNANIKALSNSHKNYESLNNIYKFIPDNFKFMEQIEKNFEFDILKPNEKMLDVFNHAKNLGKKIIIVSDIYYEKDTIEKYLTKNGFFKYDKLYLSSEFGETKYDDGKLFEVVLKDLEINNPSKILHIGDNYSSDILIPKKKGIHTHYYEKLSEKFLNDSKFKGCKSYYDEINSSDVNELVCRSYQLGILALMYDKGIFEKTDVYSQMFLYGFPFVLNFFVDFVYEKTTESQINNLAFIARDGYLMKHLFDEKYNKDRLFNSQYVYAPRFVIRTMDFNFSKMRDSDIFSVIEFYFNNNPKIKNLYKDTDFKLQNFEDIYEIFNTNKDLFKEQALASFSLYEEYLKSLNFDKKPLACVDFGALNFSAQNFLAKFVDIKSGLYCNCAQINRLDISSYIKVKTLPCFELVEMFVASPENPIYTIKKEETGEFIPVYKQTNFEDLKRNKIEDYLKLLLVFINNFNFSEISHKDFKSEKFMEIYYNIIKSLDKNQLNELSKIKNCASIAHNENDFENVWLKIKERKMSNEKVILNLCGIPIVKKEAIENRRIVTILGIKIKYKKKMKAAKETSIKLGKTISGDFSDIDYFHLIFFWEDVWNNYLKESNVVEKSNCLKKDLDNISIEYIDKFFELFNLLNLKEDLLLKTDFVWTSRDKSYLQEFKNFINTFKFPYKEVLELEKFAFSNKYGLIDLPSSVLETTNGKGIIDGGGYNGDTSLMFHYYFPKSKIYTFEPMPANYQKIKELVNINNLTDSIFPINKGLGDSETSLSLTLNDVNLDGGATFTKDRKDYHLKEDNITVTTIDKLIEENNLNVGVIKLDIEGYELKAIKGAVNTICQQKPIIVAALYHNPVDFFEIKPFLESLNLGYKFMIRRSEIVFPLADLVLIAYVEEAENENI